MPRVLWESWGVGRFLMSEVPLYEGLYKSGNSSRFSGLDCGNVTPVILQGLIKLKDTHRP
jgi:hypothetical protein